MSIDPVDDWRSYCDEVRAGRAVAFEELRARVLSANSAGLGRAALLDDLDRLLKRVEQARREPDFEVIAEMIQRCSGFFSPHGVILLKD